MKTKLYIYVLFVLVLSGLISSPLTAQDGSGFQCTVGSGQPYTAHNSKTVQISLSHTHHDPDYSKHKGRHKHEDSAQHVGLSHSIYSFSNNKSYQHMHHDIPAYNLHVLGIDAFQPQVALQTRGESCITHVKETYGIHLPGITLDGTRKAHSNQFIYTNLTYSEIHTLHIANINSKGRDFIVVADPLYLESDSFTRLALTNTGNISVITAYMIALSADVNPNIHTTHETLVKCADLIIMQNKQHKICNHELFFEEFTKYHFEGNATNKEASYKVHLHQYDSVIALTPSTHEKIEFELSGDFGQGKGGSGYYLLVLHLTMK